MLEFEPVITLQKKDGVLYNPDGEVYGYCRISTKQQNLDRQLIALEEYGVPKTMIFQDKESGKNFNRPAYKKMIRCVRKGDIIVIKSIDRLGRNYSDIIDQWSMITNDIGCGIHVIDMPMLNTSGDPESLLNQFMVNIILQVLSFVAENEREQLIKRQQEGIAAARKKRKVVVGKPRKKLPYDFWEIYLLWKEKRCKSMDLYRYCQEKWKMTERTYHRRINELDQRFGSLTNRQLRNIIPDKEMFEGIEFSNERLERGIDYYNQYVMHDPARDRRQRENRKKRLDQMTQEEQELYLKEEHLKKRRKMVHEYFGIRDENGVYIGLDTDRPKTHRRRNEAMGAEDPRTHGYNSIAQFIKNHHASNSGIEDMTILIDDKPVIPEVQRKKDPVDMMKPVRTTIVM